MSTRLTFPAFALALMLPWSAWSQVSVAIQVGPPPLPVYEQPPVPGDGYIWTPGYWGWSPDDGDYYWVPGTWVLAPRVGVLWTPGYWGYRGNGFVWNIGYWGPTVGFYGGINYGHGYTGSGYYGGRWNRGVFNYNTNFNNVNKLVIRNVYNTKIVYRDNGNRVSFNGGQGGVTLRATSAQLRVASGRHIAPTSNQTEHEREALRMPEQRASVNHGAPKVAATPKPAAFNAPEAVPARDARDAADKGPAQGDAPRQSKNQNSSQNSGPATGPARDAAQPAPTPRAERQPRNEAPAGTAQRPTPQAEPSAPAAPPAAQRKEQRQEVQQQRQEVQQQRQEVQQQKQQVQQQRQEAQQQRQEAQQQRQQDRQAQPDAPRKDKDR